MLFTQPVFFVFAFVVLGLHWWVLRTNRSRKYLLLAASYVFYGWWDPRFLSLIILSTLIDYVAALRIEAAGSSPARQRWMIMSLCSNLGMLAIFKYANFFVDSLQEGMAGFGVELSDTTLNIVLPVGISFFTFQTLSYTIDVYRGTLAPRRNLGDVALFVAFFPQLVAGPIVRAADFLPQLDTVRIRTTIPWRAACTLFLIGFFKKAVVADTLGPEVDKVFADPGAYDSFSVALAVLGYAAQIYCDFSGYSDMAIAMAMMLGYRLGANFDFPYFSPSIETFWRRWHISLSSWLRDYLYISLGGNRRGIRITYRNLMLTMVLGGLWHGAGWTFVVWGTLHGAALAANKYWADRRRHVGRAPMASPGVTIATTLATFVFVCFAWVFFRATSFANAWDVLAGLVDVGGASTASLSGWVAVYLVVAGVLHWFAYRRTFTDALNGLDVDRWAMAMGAVSVLVLAMRPLGASPFIYFQF
jgi:alginate O-acetyltransferase complex protein AlgI